jgi:adenylyltransferase/sulfurtransferase
MSSDSPRYARQTRFQPLGEEGQQALAAATVVIVGVGALGTVAADLLVRAGVGRVRLVDRDVVEESNLHRQTLFTESDARDGLPKAAAAARTLAAANSGVVIEARVTDLTAGNADGLLAGAGVVVDGTDNFETRFLLNEWAVRSGTPWIYGAAVGGYGLCLAVRPGRSACLACVFEEAPPPELAPTCETAGVLGPVTAAVAALQAGEALKLLSGRVEAVSPRLAVLDLWAGRLQQIEVGRREEDACSVCGQRRFPHLEQQAGGEASRMCGRNAVQVRPLGARPVDLPALARRLQPLGSVTCNEYLVRARLEGMDVTVFADGRTLVTGTDDTTVARRLVSRYVGA